MGGVKNAAMSCEEYTWDQMLDEFNAVASEWNPDWDHATVNGGGAANIVPFVKHLISENKELTLRAHGPEAIAHLDERYGGLIKKKIDEANQETFEALNKEYVKVCEENKKLKQIVAGEHPDVTAEDHPLAFALVEKVKELQEVNKELKEENEREHDGRNADNDENDAREEKLKEENKELEADNQDLRLELGATPLSVPPLQDEIAELKEENKELKEEAEENKKLFDTTFASVMAGVKKIEELTKNLNKSEERVGRHRETIIRLSEEIDTVTCKIFKSQWEKNVAEEFIEEEIFKTLVEYNEWKDRHPYPHSGTYERELIKLLREDVFR